MDRTTYMREIIWAQHNCSMYTDCDEIYDNLFLPAVQQSELYVLGNGDDHNIPISPVSKRTTNATVASTNTAQTASGNSTFSRVLQPASSHFKVVKDSNELSEHFNESSDRRRVMHIRQKNSQAPLRVTQDFFDELLAQAGIFDAVRDSVLYLGRRDLEVEVAPPRPSSRYIYSNDVPDGVNGHEIVYGLRFFQHNNKTDGQNPWSMRQCVVYNKTRDNPESSTWLFVSLPDIAQRAFNNYLEIFPDEMISNPFDVHLLLTGVIINLWRPYLVHLASSIDDHTQRLMLASPSGHGPLNLTEDGGERQRQQLKELEDEIIDALLSLDSTEDTLRVLQSKAACSTANNTHSEQLQTHSEDSRFNVHLAFDKKIKDIQMLRKRLTALREKLASTTQVVSTFLDLGNGFALKTLAEQAREESLKMARLGEKANRDAAAVKALTVITLIYLPMTVVLNFFSASFIDTSTGDMKLVGKWWLFLVAGIPLTVFTIYAWRIWLRFQDDGERPRLPRVLRARRTNTRPPSLPDNPSDLEKCLEIRPA